MSRYTKPVVLDPALSLRENPKEGPSVYIVYMNSKYITLSSWMRTKMFLTSLTVNQTGLMMI